MASVKPRLVVRGRTQDPIARLQTSEKADSQPARFSGGMWAIILFVSSEAMFIGDVLNSGALPTLELALRFAGQRQVVINHNIANLDTPDFRPMDASPGDFRRVLGRAIDERRARTGGEHGALEWRKTAELSRDDDGELRITPGTPSSGVLFHDRNNRDLERLMQDNAENMGAFRIAADMLKNRHDALRAAIAERVG